MPAMIPPPGSPPWAATCTQSSAGGKECKNETHFIEEAELAINGKKRLP